mgnify:CR=1 FL=1
MKNRKTNIPKVDPKDLCHNLTQFGPPYNTIPFQTFKGIFNKSISKTKGYYCFAISLFQILFHSEDVINYLRRRNLQNNTEKLLQNIYKRLYSKRNESAISIRDFLANWRGLPSSSGLLVNDSEDINELCQYLFNTCSNDFVDLFKIIYTVPLESDSSCPFYNNYFNIQFF